MSEGFLQSEEPVLYLSVETAPLSAPVDLMRVHTHCDVVLLHPLFEEDPIESLRLLDALQHRCFLRRHLLLLNVTVQLCYGFQLVLI